MLPAIARRTRPALPRPTTPDAAITIPVEVPLDLPLTLAPVAHGHGDPTIRIGARQAWRATRTPDGPATLQLVRVAEGVETRAWGPGAAW